MEKRVIAAYNKNKDEIEKSSSGAIFIAISDYILENDGIVVGAAYNYEKQKLEHIICANKKERNLCRGSKYIQSFIEKSIYQEIENNLKNNRLIFYIGLPCQVAALKNYIKLKRVEDDNLITCDILCHGVGSPGIWSKYINELEKNKKTKINYITFKDKRNGWKNPICIAKDDKQEYSIRNYSWLYFENLILRPSCYCCKFTSTNREGDFTIGDFWKVKSKLPEMYNERGTSFMMINTVKGIDNFEKFKDKLIYQECSLEDCIQNSMKKPTSKNKNRDTLMRDYKNEKKYFFIKWRVKVLLSRLKKKIIH